MARQSKLTPGQWVEIEAKYRATDIPLRELAAEYGVNEAAIRQRAKKFCWVRQPLEANRALVEAKVAGITTQSPQDATQALREEQAELDAGTLKASAAFYRKVIVRASTLLEGEEGSGKTLTETVKLATEGYMKVRGLDKSEQKSGGNWGLVLAQIEADESAGA